MEVNNDRAIKTGLTFCPITETAADMIENFRLALSPYGVAAVLTQSSRRSCLQSGTPRIPATFDFWNKKRPNHDTVVRPLTLLRESI